MGLLSFLKRSSDRPVTSLSEPAPVGDMRRRVRQRLMGALVLVVLAVVGFPLIFDSPPRPVALDIPIEIPARDSVTPLPAPVAQPAASATGVVSAAPMLTETAAEAGREVLMLPRGASAPPAAESSASAVATASASPTAVAARTEPGAAKTAEEAAEKGTDKGSEKGAEKNAEKSTDKVAEKAVGKVPGPAPASAAASPAKAPQAGVAGVGASAPPAEGRFVVQVGAFSEAASAREARRKLEKLGLRTYTQVVETAAGARTRVRAGPFGERAEAERAATQIKQSGLPAALLTL